MSNENHMRRDLTAVALLALVVFLVASLLSFDPADPPGDVVYPLNEQVNNLCGHYGAHVSWWLLALFGAGAFYVLLSLVLLDFALLRRQRLGQPVLRTCGWLLSLAGICALFGQLWFGLWPGPVIGPGGYLGALVRSLLELHFARVGAVILALTMTIGGLLLATDRLAVQLFVWGVFRPLAAIVRSAYLVLAAYLSRAGLEVAAAQASGKAESSARPTVKGRGDSTSAGRAAADRTGPEAASDRTADGPPQAPAEAPHRDISALRIRKPKRNARDEVSAEIDLAADGHQASDYQLPSIDLLLEGEPFCFEQQEREVRERACVLEQTFAHFGLNVRVVEIQTGPVIAQFEIELEAGLRLSKVASLADDLAIGLRVPSVRIVAPIPGKNTVGIEVPNGQRQLVRLREVMEEAAGVIHTMRIPIFLGKDVAGNPIVVDLASLPHLLIAGRTGTGKSVCLNSIIVSILMCRRPDEVRMLLVDPKMVELSPYKRIPHLMHPVVTDMRKAEAILAWAVEKMEQRYQLLARAGVRHLSVYNQLGEEELYDRIQPASEEEWAQIPRRMPYIVIVADEMADLMMTAAKEVESHIIRLAQKSRAVGIHLVLATQKPTVDVITGLIKSNLPARICFEVSSRTDSRVVLDEMGADRLLGNGDMLFLRPGTSTLIRGQGTYLSDDEIARVIDAVATSEPNYVNELVELDSGQEPPKGGLAGSRDQLYEAAVDVVVREGRGSVSLLQRALGIGYGRAARLIDYMAEDGIVGPYNGSQAREVLVGWEQWEQMRAGTSAEGPSLVVPKRSNRIRLREESDASGHACGHREDAAEQCESLGDEGHHFPEDGSAAWDENPGLLPHVGGTNGVGRPPETDEADLRSEDGSNGSRPLREGPRSAGRKPYHRAS